MLCPAEAMIRFFLVPNPAGIWTNEEEGDDDDEEREREREGKHRERVREREEERTRVHKKYWHTPDIRMAHVSGANLLPLLPVVITKRTSRTNQLIRRVSGSKRYMSIISRRGIYERSENTSARDMCFCALAERIMKSFIYKLQRSISRGDEKEKKRKNEHEKKKKEITYKRDTAKKRVATQREQRRTKRNERVAHAPRGNAQRRDYVKVIRKRAREGAVPRALRTARANLQHTHTSTRHAVLQLEPLWYTTSRADMSGVEGGPLVSANPARPNKFLLQWCSSSSSIVIVGLAQVACRESREVNCTLAARSTQSCGARTEEARLHEADEDQSVLCVCVYVLQLYLGRHVDVTLRREAEEAAAATRKGFFSLDYKKRINALCVVLYESLPR
ncbi:unnamed protein product [Trichogramma brassicae]|uniref:Uncharacterized protein n=1 Tax=Trichogramma brassicae TaxID=86971 RepID=A0A6H5ISR0_9HYME|nr:unnamed protein product [Trichogramma brassicae]